MLPAGTVLLGEFVKENTSRDEAFHIVDAAMLGFADVRTVRNLLFLLDTHNIIGTLC